MAHCRHLFHKFEALVDLGAQIVHALAHGADLGTQHAHLRGHQILDGRPNAVYDVFRHCRPKS